MSFSVAINERLSTFFEYNSYSFMIGSSIVPTDKVRFTVGITLAESYDDYKLKDFDNMRLFGRLSIAL